MASITSTCSKTTSRGHIRWPGTVMVAHATADHKHNSAQPTSPFGALQRYVVDESVHSLPVMSTANGFVGGTTVSSSSSLITGYTANCHPTANTPPTSSQPPPASTAVCAVPPSPLASMESTYRPPPQRGQGPGERRSWASLAGGRGGERPAWRCQGACHTRCRFQQQLQQQLDEL